jgi:CBS domain-containing protein
MAIGDICNREVVVVSADASVAEAAKLMRQYHVGDLVVVFEKEGRNEPVGIVTDRDLVVEVMAPAVDAATVTVGDIMAPRLVKLRDDTGVFESIRYMREQGVRRMPVVDVRGGLVGILTLDDVLELLSEEMAELTKLVQTEHKKETRNRR